MHVRRAIMLGVISVIAASGTAAAAPEVSTSSRLSDRREVTAGQRSYAEGFENARWYANGWHITGEMGGVWAPPLKLVDGVWFGLDGQWIGEATRFSSGWGYTRYVLPDTDGVQLQRIDFAPDANRAVLFGLKMTNPGGARTVTVNVDSHSELLRAYPWGFTTPSAADANAPDSGAYNGRDLVFADTGHTDWSALVGSNLAPDSGVAAASDGNYRGPQSKDTVCAANDGTSPPSACDDGPYGRGTGGELTYKVALPANGTRTLWIAVAGSDKGLSDAQSQLAGALRDPAGELAAKIASREALGNNTVVSLPGDPLLQDAVTWGKQNLADETQTASDLQIRWTNQGKQYPPPLGTVAHARWFAAGYPDYPWIFATDGEYTAFAAVAAGQFAAVKNHLKALRDISEIANNRSGKVVHEVTPDGQVYYGSNADPGNTDETVKFPSAVALVWRWTGDNAFRDNLYDFAVRNMKYAVALDADGDGWPEGSGNVERGGMGQEKLDVAVYTIRGLLDLADMAASKGDVATARWATNAARDRAKKFEQTWWYGGDAKSYADSLSDPGNVKLYQRYWIGATPMEAELPAVSGMPKGGPLASTEHANVALTQRERDCFTGEFGFFHTGTGPTSDPGGNKGPSCDSVVSAVGSERDIFSLGNAIMAVAEGNYGRLTQAQHYTTANARSALDPSVWEMPGAMPEILPSPDFGTNMSKDFLSRSSVMQAWGAYGVLWPVVHQQLGVSPDLGNGELSVVPQIPAGQSKIAGSNIRVGSGCVSVTATRTGKAYKVSVDAAVTAKLVMGVVLPDGANVASVTLDGKPSGAQRVHTARGLELLVKPHSSGKHTLVVTLR